MKKVFLLLFVFPILAMSQTQTENYLKEISYQLPSNEAVEYAPLSINLTTADLLLNTIGFGGANCSIEMNHYNIFDVYFTAQWPTTNRLKVGVVKALNTYPNLPNMELGPILTAENNGNQTGIFAKIQSNSLVFYSPYFLDGANLSSSVSIPSGLAIKNYSVAIPSPYLCGTGGTGSGGGTVTVNRTSLSGSVSISLNASWSEICTIKTGQIVYLNTSAIPNVELGIIKSNGIETAYRARIVNNWLEFYAYQTIPPLPSTGFLKFNKDFGVGINEKITYIDGLGRPKQEILKKQSPSHKDIVTHKEYDSFGSASREYLNFESDLTNYGGYINHTVAKSKQRQFYYAKHNDSIAYSESLLEKSNSRRVMKTAFPGEAWRLGSNNDVILNAETNRTEDKVQRLEVNYTSNNKLQPTLKREGYYSPAKLLKSIVKNENWKQGQVNPADNTVVEFRNVLGQIVLKRAHELGKWHDTYYVYDDLGNLVFVLPPELNTYPSEQQIWPAVSHFFNNVTTFYAPGYTTGETNDGSVEVYNNTIWFYFDNYGSGPNGALNTTGAVIDLDINPPLPNMQLGPVQIKKADGSISNAHYNAYIQDGDIRLSGDGTPAYGVYIYLNVNLNTVVLPDIPISIPNLNDFAYQYKYDERNRMIEKKLPGKDWEYIVYDKLDRPILNQDANLKAQNKWNFTKYDVFNRVVYTGTWTNSVANQSRQAVQNLVNTQVNPVWNITRRAAPFMVGGSSGNEGPATLYYTNDTFPKLNSELVLLTINYYDDYVFDIAGLSSESSFGITPTTNVKSLTTGSKIRILGTNSWITSLVYYDQKARPIFNVSKNDYLATTDKVKLKLDFTGKVLESESTHIKGANTLLIKDKFTYDHTGRLLTSKQQIGTMPEQLIAKNTYDELGGLVKKEVGNSESIPLQKIDLNYNIRGWLKSVNSTSRMENDLFSYAINYNEADPANIYQKPLYDGNISAVSWKTDNISTALKSYFYSYDNLGRLQQSYYAENSVVNNKFNESINGGYDRAGNIKGLYRAMQHPTSPTSYQAIDALTYTYRGNKLYDVKDAYGLNTAGAQGFKDNNTVGDDYSYDPNGNIKTDKNKGITSIEYNHLNLPTKIVFNNADVAHASPQVIQYYYDANGIKQEKIVKEPKLVNGNMTNTSTSTLYAGNYIYQNGTLQFFSHPEGYVANNAGIYSYVFQYKDHLGNVRLSYTDMDNDGIIKGASSEILYDGFETSSGWDANMQYDASRKNSGNIGGRIVKATAGALTSQKTAWTAISNAATTEYIVSGWVYSDNPTASITLLMRNAAQTVTTSSVTTNQKNRWVFIEKKVAVPSTITSLGLRMENNGGGTVWFDDLAIRKVNATTEIVEENNYYPFGLKHKDSNNLINLNKANPIAQKYKFGGKEFEESMGINNYDFGARNYEPAIGRWMNIDPLADRFVSQSPYNFCFNNPLYYVDPDGNAPLDWYRNNKTGNIVWRDGSSSISGYSNIGSHTNLVSGTGQEYQLNTNGTFKDLKTGRSYGNNETVIANSSTGQTLTSKQNWIQRNLVIELSLTGSIGAQVGGKLGIAEGSAGLMSTEIGTAVFDLTSLDFDKSAWGDGSIHNYAEIMIGIEKTQLALGGKFDQHYSSMNAMSGKNGLLKNGDFDLKFSTDYDFAPNLLPKYEGLNIQPSATHGYEDDFMGFQFGVGGKMFFGLELNFQFGLQEPWW